MLLPFNPCAYWRNSSFHSTFKAWFRRSKPTTLDTIWHSLNSVSCVKFGYCSMIKFIKAHKDWQVIKINYTAQSLVAYDWARLYFLVCMRRSGGGRSLRGQGRSVCGLALLCVPCGRGDWHLSRGLQHQVLPGLWPDMPEQWGRVEPGECDHTMHHATGNVTLLSLQHDSGCSALGGECKLNSNYCDGSYQSGLCGGPANRQCCSQGESWPWVCDIDCHHWLWHPRWCEWVSQGGLQVRVGRSGHQLSQPHVSQQTISVCSPCRDQCLQRCGQLQSDCERWGHMTYICLITWPWLSPGIQDWHINGNGWCDIGYSFLVGGDGNIYEGRGWDEIGAHTGGFNSVVSSQYSSMTYIYDEN